MKGTTIAVALVILTGIAAGMDVMDKWREDLNESLAHPDLGQSLTVETKLNASFANETQAMSYMDGEGYLNSTLTIKQI